ncbi:uncharacterized protein [Labrus bergylta]
MELHPLLIKIIDTPQFQRLRLIKQLGGVYSVYPGASHNRFEHSIGVGYLAGKLAEALRSKQPKLEIDDRDVLCVQIAGLCHDLGHGPFSHLYDGMFLPKALEKKEEEMRKNGKLREEEKLEKWKHEKGSCDMLDHLLKENNLEPVMEKYGLEPEEDITLIKEMIAGPLQQSKEQEHEKGSCDMLDHMLKQKYLKPAIPEEDMTEDRRLQESKEQEYEKGSSDGLNHLLKPIDPEQVMKEKYKLKPKDVNDIKVMIDEQQSKEQKEQSKLEEEMMKKHNLKPEDVKIIQEKIAEQESKSKKEQSKLEQVMMEEYKLNPEDVKNIQEMIAGKESEGKKEQSKLEQVIMKKHNLNPDVVKKIQEKIAQQESKEQEEQSKLEQVMMKKYGLKEEDVKIIQEMIAVEKWPYNGRSKEWSFLYEIVSNKKNGVDVDKFDYLARDSSYLGIKNNFDFHRFLKFARVCEVDGRKTICTRDKEEDHMYDLFYTRHRLHKRACQHRVSQIIQEMIAEAFLKADNHIQIEGSGGRMFTLSTAIEDMEAYTKLTDKVFEEILNSSDPNLQDSRQILQNIISRKIYKFVGERKQEDPIQDWKSRITGWKEGLAQPLPDEEENNLELEDFEILVIEMDYGMDDKDPIQHVHFYSKSELDKAKPMPEEKLVALCQPRLHPAERPDIPAELRRKRRGCRAGVKCREKKRRYKPSVPSLIMGNVRSLPNKMEELTALTRLQREYRECSIMQFTETWLNELTPDTLVTLDGFHLVRADRSARESGKKKGGGIAMYVNERWCNSGHITVKEQRCTKDAELLAVSIRPYYLPREFSHVIAVTVYIPPSADAAAACELIHSVVSQLQTSHPQSLTLISGDFNHVSLSATLPTFTQYVDCHTRDNKTLDLLYANTKAAYRSSPLPPLGRSDHNLVRLQPIYIPMVKKQPPTTRYVKKWSKEATEALQDCFDTTDWEVLCSPHGEDIDGLTHCITDYINFCDENTVPTKKIQCFSNNKPWVTPELKTLLNEKRRVFRSGDREELRRVQKDSSRLKSRN